MAVETEEFTVRDMFDAFWGELSIDEENITRCNNQQNRDLQQFIIGKPEEELFFYNVNIYESDEDKRHLIPFQEVGCRTILNFEFDGIIHVKDKEKLQIIQRILEEWDVTPTTKKIEEVYAILDTAESHLTFFWI